MSRQKKRKQQQGVQSVETGIQVAFALARLKGPAPLRDLAKATNISASKMHRYLVSLCRAGLLEQRESDGLYDLGQGAIALGLAAQMRLDAFRHVDGVVQRLFAATQLTVSVFVWGNKGPTVVRRVEPYTPIVLTTRLGSVVSIVNTAAGRLFAAFLPDEVVAPIRDAELSAGVISASTKKPMSKGEFETIVAKVRKEGISSVKGDFLAGFDAISAPVFDDQGVMLMALTLIIPQRSFQPGEIENIQRLLKREADAFSVRLGSAAP